MIWPLPGIEPSLPPEDGRFGAVRRYDRHTGIDLYCPEGQPVVSIEPGVVVGILPFTGPEAESPWWLPTMAVLVEGSKGVVCYGEIKPTTALLSGEYLGEGALIGTVQRVLRHDKGRPTTMLHLERYVLGTRDVVWWRLGEDQPVCLLDPTSLVFPGSDLLSGS